MIVLVISSNYFTISLRIITENKFTAEKQFLFKTIFNTWLELDYTLEYVNASQNYVIYINSNHKIEIKDSFFSSVKSNYLNKDYLPQKIKTEQLNIGDDKCSNHILYGESGLESSEGNFILNNDIFGATFILLTRLEEYLSEVKDEHGRFPLEASFLYKNNLHQIPIVDVNLKILALLLSEIDPNLQLKTNDFRIQASHDIDYYQRWMGFRSLAGSVKRSIFKAKPGHTIQYFNSYFKSENLYDNIDHLCRLSEDKGVKAKFYFLCGGNSAYDRSKIGDYEKEWKAMVQKVAENGHEIGIHPSYMSMEKPELIMDEKNRLEAVWGKEITKSRQHYLRIQLPQSLRNLRKYKIEEDASLGFSKEPGFRSSTSRMYEFFDLEKGENTGLLLQPLIFMDTSLINDKSRTFEEKYEMVENIKSQIREFGGNWSFLIHNTSFAWLDEKEYHELWRNLYNI